MRFLRPIELGRRSGRGRVQGSLSGRGREPLELSTDQIGPGGLWFAVGWKVPGIQEALAIEVSGGRGWRLPGSQVAG